MLIYILTNEIGSKLVGLNSPECLVIMNVGIMLHAIIVLVKAEHEEEIPMKI